MVPVIPMLMVNLCICIRNNTYGEYYPANPPSCGAFWVLNPPKDYTDKSGMGWNFTGMHLYVMVFPAFPLMDGFTVGTSITVNLLLLSSWSRTGTGGGPIDVYIDGQMVKQGNNYSPYQSDDPLNGGCRVSPLTIEGLNETTHTILLLNAQSGLHITMLNEYSYVP